MQTNIGCIVELSKNLPIHMINQKSLERSSFLHVAASQNSMDEQQKIFSQLS